MNVKRLQLRVNRIESFKDISGNLGKKIELVEDVKIPGAVGTVFGMSDEAKMVADVMGQIQKQLPFFQREFYNPKIWLFLTEEEYEAMGISLDVNQTYEVTFENQTVKFSKPTGETEHVS